MTDAPTTESLTAETLKSGRPKARIRSLPWRIVRGLLTAVAIVLSLIYFTVVRSFLFVLALYICVHFFLGTDMFREVITTFIAGEIPGQITVGGVQWGPRPDQVVVLDTTISGEFGQTLLNVPMVRASLDLTATVEGMALMAARGKKEAPLTILFEEATLHDAHVRVVVDDEGLVDFERAFYIPIPGAISTPDNLNIGVENVIMTGTTGVVDLPEVQVTLNGLKATGSWYLKRDVEMHFGIQVGRAEHADIWIKPADRPTESLERLHIPLDDVGIIGFDFVNDYFTIMRASGAIGTGSFRLGGQMELDHDEPRWAASAFMDIPEDTGLLERFTGGLVRGSVLGEIRGRGDVKWATAHLELTAPRLSTSTHTAEAVALTVDIDPQIGPDGSMTHIMEVRHAEADMFGGRVAISPATYRPGWARARGLGRPARATHHDFDAVLRLSGVDPWTVLGPEGVGLTTGALPFLEGSLDGQVIVGGYVESATDRLVIDAETADLRASWLGSPDLPLSPVYTLSGGVRWHDGPAASEHGQTDLEPVQTLTLQDLVLDSGSDRAAVDGLIDFGRKMIELRADGGVDDLGALLRTQGIDAVGGRMVLSRAHIWGPFENPSGQVTVQVADALLAGEAMGAVGGTVALRQGRLSVEDLDARTPFGDVKGSGDVTLWTESIDSLHPRMPFTIHSLDTNDLALHRLLPQVGIEASLDIHAKGVRGDAQDPWRTALGDAEIVATQIKWGAERIERVATSVHADGTQLVFGDLGIRLAGSARGEKHQVSGHLHVDKRSGAISITAHAEDLPWSAIRWFKREDLPMLGTAKAAHLVITGWPEQPEVHGEISVGDFGFGPIQLGDATLALNSAPGGPVMVTAEPFFPGLSLLPVSHLILRDGLPSEVHLEAVANDADGFAIFPGLQLPRTELRFGAPRPDDPDAPSPDTARVRLDLCIDNCALQDGRRQPPWRVRMNGEAGDLRSSIFEGEVKFANTDAVALDLGPEGTRIAPVTFAGPKGPALRVCGHMSPDLDLDIRFAGGVSAELIRLRDLFSNLDGGVVIAPDIEVASAIIGDRCLPDVGDAILRVIGTVDQPIIEGRVHGDMLTFMPRALPREVRIRPGTGITFRRGTKPGLQRLVFEEPATRRLRGVIDEGDFSLLGEIVLQDLELKEGAITLQGNDISYASSGEYTFTATPDLSLTIADFGSDTRRALVLTGSVRVTDGLYYKNFDLLGQALETATGGGSEQYSESLTESLPWLADLEMDIAVSSSEFAVRSSFTLGKADIETRADLRLFGGLDDLKLEKRIDFIPGGTVSYQLFDTEFEIVRGTVDFDGDPGRARVDIEAQTEVTYYLTVDYRAQREEERTVIISLLVSGQLPEPTVSLISDDSRYDPADLQSLLLTGKPRGTAHARDNELFTLDFADLVDAVLRAPFIDDASVILTQAGGWGGEFTTAFGRTLRLRTRAVRETSETRVTAGFEFRISDDISMEGRLLRIDSAANPSQTYEARLKYRIPLD